MPNSDPQDIKHQQNIESIKELHNSVDRLERRIEALTLGVGSTVQNHGIEIAVLKDNVRDLRTVTWCIFGSSIGIILMAFWKLILR